MLMGLECPCACGESQLRSSMPQALNYDQIKLLAAIRTESSPVA